MKKSTMTTKKKLRKQHNLPSWISSSHVLMEALLVPVVEALVPVVENLRRLQASS